MEVVAEEVIEIKKEIVEEKEFPGRNRTVTPAKFIDVSSTSSDSDSSDTDDLDTEGSGGKKRKLECVLPVGFLDPLPPQERTVFLRKRKITNSPAPRVESKAVVACSSAAVQSCKQFWKAGDYGGENVNDSAAYFGGIDHVRVHPKFLHSNATSHKWALGAFAELLDNALDEVCNGATYVHVDVLENRQDTNKMLLVEDNGGGMTPEKMRHCMSLGYSSKSKMANTIGQYGNGFKTSTMRLGADVIVFSRCQGADGRSVTQSIGMLSYTFLRRTGKEDIVVPMIDYERRGQDWNKLMRSSNNDWNRNLETILQWSPYSTEEDLLQQFNSLKDQGTRIIIYNLWEDVEGRLELDFDVDPDDIQIRESNRDEKKIEMATKYPNSRHFLTYRHSLRSYASILYLRIPSGFRIILRGKDDVHHNLVNDMMLKEERTYKPVGTDKTSKDLNMMAIVAIGFVKDAKYHIDIQGFNVYHKNRLIKPFWRVWNAAGSDGRGVIGVLEADFVEPAHDKQGFERTTALSRLEQRLIVFQKQYWGQNCHKIGYARRRRLKKSVSPDRENTSNVLSGNSNSKGRSSNKGGFKLKSSKRNENAVPAEDAIQDEIRSASHERPAERSHQKALFSEKLVTDINGDKRAHADSTPENTVKLEAKRVKRERLENDGLMVDNLMWELQKERAWSSSLEIKLMEAQNKIQAMDKEQEALVDIFSEERSRRDAEEESLRNRLKVASDTINDLFDKVKLLESKSMVSCKNERSNG